MRILLVEDDERIADSLAEALTDQHYVVDIAADGQIGWEFVKSFTYNIIHRNCLFLFSNCYFGTS